MKISKCWSILLVITLLFTICPIPPGQAAAASENAALAAGLVTQDAERILLEEDVPMESVSKENTPGDNVPDQNVPEENSGIEPGELEVSAAAATPGKELARGKSITASSQVSSSGRVAVNANDGDLSTQWESAAKPASITIDLESVYPVAGVAMSLGPNWTARTQSIAVEGSRDGETYMTLVPEGNYSFQKDPKHRVELEFASADLRYVRFTGTSNSNPNGIQFAELEVYQDPNHIPPELPDLSVSSVHLAPSAPEPGDEVTFSAEIRNDGTGTLTDSDIRVGFTLNPVVNDTTVTDAVYAGSLGPGDTVTVTGTTTWTASLGTYALQAEVSAEIQETDDRNNAKMDYFAVRQPAAERTEFEERAEYVLLTLATSEPTQADRTLWVKEAVFHAQARFALGVDVEQGLEYIASINNNPAGASMFFYTANIDTYLKYGHLYPVSLREKVKANMLAADYSNNGSTENHFLKFRTAGYLVAQTWPDWSQAQATKAFAERDISDMLERFVKYGMKEYDSTTYWALYVECLLMLHDLADDPQMKQKAKMALDWIIANTAADWLDGYWVSSTVRDYMGMSPKLGAAGTTMAWLYLGGEERPRLLKNELNYPEGMYSVVAAVSSYRVPELIRAAAAERGEPYTNLESHDQYPSSKLNWPHGYRKTTYIAEHYGVASQFDGYGTLGWSDQLRRWFVRWKSEDAFSTFYVSHPKNGALQSGATPYEQVLQHGGTLLAVTQIPAGDPKPYIAGPLPSGVIDTVEDSSGWIFAHEGNVLLAVKIMKPYSWTEESVGPLAIPVLRSEGLKNAVIVETADPGDYAEAGDDGKTADERRASELARFMEAIKSGTRVEAARLDEANPTVVYHSLAGDTLSLTFNGERSVNGESVDYTSWPLIDNPYMHQEVGSPILRLMHDGETVEYDFDNWTIQGPTGEPDLSVTGAGTEPEIPKAGQELTFKAAVRNAGLSSLPGGFEVVFSLNGDPVSTIAHPSALAAGETVTVSSEPWTFEEEGSYSLSVSVRAIGWQEQNQSNNRFDRPIEVGGALRELFADDFERDIVTNWDSGGSVGSWSQVSDPSIGSKVMKGTSTATNGNPVRKVAKSTAWADYERTNRDYDFSFKARYLTGVTSGGSGEQMRALVRFANVQAYSFFEFSARANEVSFWKYTSEQGFVNLSGPVSIAAKLPDFDFNKYNDYKIRAKGDVISLSINGQLIMETKQISDITGGSVGFMNRNSELWIDQVRVQTIEDEVPGPGDPTSFDFDLVQAAPGQNGEIEVVLKASQASDLYGFVFDMNYDREKLKLARAEADDEFGEHAYVTFQERADRVRIVGTRTALDGESGVDGDARLLRLVFNRLEPLSEFELTLLKGSDYSDSTGKRTILETPIRKTLPVLTADVNGDGKVGIDDLVLVAKAFGARRGDEGYKAACDVNRDGVIDIEDLSYVALQLMQS
ncbi:CARDB domain-containing protein [Paenibacillus sp. A14]|uniref:CARDB domain-containing protein n=1 Tax=Paenibacillus sp. A14 TaxID=3119820 RepID=UPI002FE3553B